MKNFLTANNISKQPDGVYKFVHINKEFIYDTHKLRFINALDGNHLDLLEKDEIPFVDSSGTIAFIGGYWKIYEECSSTLINLNKNAYLKDEVLEKMKMAISKRYKDT